MQLLSYGTKLTRPNKKLQDSIHAASKITQHVKETISDAVAANQH